MSVTRRNFKPRLPVVRPPETFPGAIDAPPSPGASHFLVPPPVRESSKGPQIAPARESLFSRTEKRRSSGTIGLKKYRSIENRKISWTRKNRNSRKSESGISIQVSADNRNKKGSKQSLRSKKSGNSLKTADYYDKSNQKKKSRGCKCRCRCRCEIKSWTFQEALEYLLAMSLGGFAAAKILLGMSKDAEHFQQLKQLCRRELNIQLMIGSDPKNDCSCNHISSRRRNELETLYRASYLNNFSVNLGELAIFNYVEAAFLLLIFLFIIITLPFFPYNRIRSGIGLFLIIFALFLSLVSITSEQSLVLSPFSPDFDTNPANLKLLVHSLTFLIVAIMTINMMRMYRSSEKLEDKLARINPRKTKPSDNLIPPEAIFYALNRVRGPYRVNSSISKSPSARSVDVHVIGNQSRQLSADFPVLRPSTDSKESRSLNKAAPMIKIQKWKSSNHRIVPIIETISNESLALDASIKKSLSKE